MSVCVACAARRNRLLLVLVSGRTVSRQDRKMAFNFGGAAGSASLSGTGFGAATTTSASTGFGFGSGSAGLSFGGFGLGPVAPGFSLGLSDAASPPPPHPSLLLIPLSSSSLLLLPLLILLSSSSPSPSLRQAVGYSCVPAVKDEDGLVALALNKKEAEVRAQQQQLVESLHRVLGGVPTLTLNVEGVRALPDDQTEVVVYLVERSPNGTSKRVPASTLYSYMEQMNIKSQLQQLAIFMTVSRTALTPAQLKQLLQNPPAGVDPIIWEQAKVDNPDPEKLIPVPMVGFRELLRRLKIQDQMSKQHQTRVDIISNDISELQRNQATTAAKITQYKRKLMDLSHRVLQVLIKQEVQRKSGYAIQLDEEHLRVQLETIQSDLNAPTQFKGRLNELMSQIRMQNHFGAVRSEERYRVDADLLREIKQHLKHQQEGLSHLISVIKDDLDDIKTVEDGLQDSIHGRSSKLS
ncbi:nucleoporin p54 [Pseudorasbora parva]|uniref:nucleoporin p54 n=1 Tax=Pseudorasbora parva TaxID=51549 RepID=UPI00351EB349